MDSYLLHHAIDNVWCSPDQDHQYLFQPARLTVPQGARRVVNVEWDQYILPDQTSRYHVYQIGQLSPLILNLLPDVNRWYSVQEAMNTRPLVINFYTRQGLHLPRDACFIRHTSSRNLILAVKEQPVITDLSTAGLFVRFYSNAFFNSERSQDGTHRIRTQTLTVSNRAGVINFLQRMEEARISRPGIVYQFHNGFLVDQLRPNIIQTQDVIEWVQDTSVEEVLDIPIADLSTFTSTLDGIRKYLVLRSKCVTDTIDYHDDIDFWLYRPAAGSFTGVFYHKANAQSVRMITHKDYALPVQAILDHTNRIGWPDSQELVLRLHLRKSGYHRPLVHEHHRIHELRRLSDDAIARAMVGTNALVPEWQVANLETSTYTRLMRSNFEQLTPERVYQAYGYNAVSKLVGDTPQIPFDESGRLVTEPPFKLRALSTMYEYDRQGRLINYYYHEEGRTYPVRNEHTGYVEGIVGRGGMTTGTTYDLERMDIPEGVGFQAYICDIVGGEPTYLWRQALPGRDYQLRNESFLWCVDMDQFLTAVRIDGVFLARDYLLVPFNGVLKFSIVSRERVGVQSVEGVLLLPPGKLDLWLNGHPLIENLDYFVQGYDVVICNKEYLDPSLEEQRITVRAMGFPDAQGRRLPVAEFGFVEHGLLSRNNRFDIRDDKVLRYVVEGRLWTREDLIFSENDRGVRMEHVRNGAPYVIDEIIVPVPEVGNGGTYPYRNRSREVDERISDYLTLYFPEPVIEGPSIIQRRYQVLSPFTSRVHWDLLNGYLYPEKIKEQYSDMDIREWLKSYEWLLEYDPIIRGVDERYVAVHPHHLFIETELDVYQYKFLQRVIAVYLNNKVDLSHHVRIKEGWI